MLGNVDVKNKKLYFNDESSSNVRESMVRDKKLGNPAFPRETRNMEESFQISDSVMMMHENQIILNKILILREYYNSLQLRLEMSIGIDFRLASHNMIFYRFFSWDGFNPECD